MINEQRRKQQTQKESTSKQAIKNKSSRISANEINRFVYCPYAWYYNRYYGQKALKEKYQALKNKNSKIESQFKKGLRFHKNYYRQYRLQCLIRGIILLVGSAVLIWAVMKWH